MWIFHYNLQSQSLCFILHCGWLLLRFNGFGADTWHSNRHHSHRNKQQSLLRLVGLTGRTSSSSFEDAQQYQSWGNFVRSRAVNLKFFLRAVFAVQTVPGTKVNKVFPPRWRKLQEESSKQKSFYLCDQNKFCIYVYHYNAETSLTCVGLVNLTLAELCYLSWLWLTLASRKYGTTTATGQ